MHHKGVKNYMELSISIYRTVGIEFPSLYALFGEQKKRTTWVSSASIVLNALLETSELTTIETSQRWKKSWKLSHFRKLRAKRVQFFAVFGARIQIFEKNSGSTRMKTGMKIPL